MKIASFLKIFYAYQFLFDLVFIYAVDKLFFLQRGINLSQIAVLLSIWAGTSLVLEVPTGILADRWNRKYMLILAGLFYALAYLIWIFSYGFWGFALGFFFRSIASNFKSGTLQAYLHDFLSAHNQQDHFEKIWGRGRAFTLAGIALAWSIGGYLSEYSYLWVLILSSVLGLVVATVALLFPEVKQQGATEHKSVFKFLGTSLKYAFKHPLILRAFLFTAIVSSSYGVIDEYWGVYFNWLGVSNGTFGVLVAVATLIGGISGLWAHYFSHRAWLTISILTIYFSFVLILVGISRSSIVIFLLLSLEAVLNISGILIEGVIQRNVDSSIRATVSSTNALMGEVSIVTGLIFGYIAYHYGIQMGYSFFGLFVLLYFIAQFVIKLRGLEQHA